MIDYDTGEWGVGFIFQLQGSVYLKTLLWSVPSTAIAVVVHIVLRLRAVGYINEEDGEERTMGIQMGIGAYTTVLSFLLVFRTQQAYARWWEGGSLLQTLRGEWFNAYSNLLSFISRQPGRMEEAEEFQHLLVRLMSLLHGAAMQQVSTTECTYFEIIDLSGLDLGHLEFLQNSDAQCEIILQWIQRMIVQAMEKDILPIPAPILSRVFQELSRGIVNLANARKISELPFPFPYAQMITVSLIIHWVMMPLLMGIYCNTGWVAGFLTFVTVTSLWSINYVAQEIESPYGDDDNDLPLMEMQMSFNRNLVSLMMAEAQEAPTFSLQDAHATRESTPSPVCTQTTTKTLIDDLCSKPVPSKMSPSRRTSRLAGTSEHSAVSNISDKQLLHVPNSAKRQSAFTVQAVERYDQKLRLAAAQVAKERLPPELELSDDVLDPAPHSRAAGAGPPQACAPRPPSSGSGEGAQVTRQGSKTFASFRFNWRGSTASNGAACPDSPQQRKTFRSNRLVTGTLVPPRHTLMAEPPGRGGGQLVEDVYSRRSI